jgi:hypothetical protein
MEMECGLQQIKMRHASRDASRLDSAAVAAAGDHNHRQQWARYTYGEDGVSERANTVRSYLPSDAQVLPKCVGMFRSDRRVIANKFHVMLSAA